MLEGLYTAAAGLAAQQQRLDAVADDIANVSTPGYRHNRLGFRDLVYQANGVGSGVATTVVGRSQVQGALRETGDPLDLAIQGEGFFRTSEGLTRSGAFQLNANRQVTTTTGALLDPPLTLPEGEVVIAGDGTVSVDGREVGRIAIEGPGQIIQGALEGSNVDLATAMVDMMDAQRSFSLASRAIQVQDELMQIANGVKRA